MEAFKKTISLLLVFSISFQQLFAEDIFKKYGMMGNSTPAKTWFDERTGITYASGGSATYKFKRNNNFAPWAEFSTPHGGISCSGFSFDLGFAGIMNLDKIKDQLDKAGQAFMWGLLTVFKLSTPNLEAIFEYINKIVRQIQDLLRNACAIASKIAASASKKYRSGKDTVNVASFIDDRLESLTPKESSEFQNKGIVDKINTTLDGWASKPAKERNSNESKVLMDVIGIAYNEDIHYGALSIIDDTVKAYATMSRDRPEYAHYYLKDIIVGKKVGVGADSNGKTVYKPLKLSGYATKDLMAMSLFFSIYFLGTPLLSIHNNSLIQNKINKLAEAKDEDYKKVIQDAMRDATRGVNDLKIDPVEAFYPVNIETSKDIIDILLDGPKNKKLSIKNIFLISVVLPPLVLGSNDKFITPLYAYYGVKMASGGNIEFDFAGFNKGSRDGVNSLLNKFSVDPNGNYVAKYANTEPPAIPTMFKGLSRYTQIIDDYITKHPNRTQRAADMANNLIKINSLMAAKEVLANIVFSPFKKPKPGSKLYSAYMKAVNALDIIRKKIKESTAGGFVGLAEKFDIEDAKNKNKWKK